MTPPTPVDSILVCGPRPEFDCDRVVFTPPASSTFDGDRWSVPCRIQTVVDEEVVERTAVTLGRSRAILKTEIDRVSPAIVIVERPSSLHRAYPDGRGRRLASFLRVAAHREGATIVGWQRASPDARDRRHYAVVMERPPRHVQGRRRASRRHRRSDTADTAR